MGLVYKSSNMKKLSKLILVVAICFISNSFANPLTDEQEANTRHIQELLKLLPDGSYDFRGFGFGTALAAISALVKQPNIGDQITIIVGLDKNTDARREAIKFFVERSQVTVILKKSNNPGRMSLVLNQSRNQEIIESAPEQSNITPDNQDPVASPIEPPSIQDNQSQSAQAKNDQQNLLEDVGVVTCNLM